MYNHVSADPLNGTLFDGRYLINFLIARGGMGNIYQANDIKLGRIVAIKMLRSEYSSDEVILKRFFREAEAVKSLHHPNICQLYDTGCTSDGIHYFTMEYLEGAPLDTIIRERHIIEPTTAVRYIMQVASALCEAHNNGIVHRDLKPANIFIVHTPDAQNIAKLLDFGVAKMSAAEEHFKDKLTNSGATLGTPYYMSPEQIEGKPIDGRSDVFGLGVILWECLFGTLPFNGKTLIDIFHSILNDRLPRLPWGLRRQKHWKKIYSVLNKALQRDVRQRYDSIQSFLRALEHINADLTGIPMDKSNMHTPPSLPVFEAFKSSSFVQFFTKLTPIRLILLSAALIFGISTAAIIFIFVIPRDSAQQAARFDTYKFFSDIPAKIYINGEESGSTPLSIDISKPLPISIIFESASGKKHQFTVTNLPDTGNVSGFSVIMKPSKSERPMIHAETTPPNANVYINGSLYPIKTPCQIGIDSANDIQLEYQLDGYRTEHYTIAHKNSDVHLRSNLYRL